MKKHFKRGIALVLVATLLLLSFSLTAFAGENDNLLVSVDSVSGCPGDSIQVPIKLTNNKGLASFKINITYDSSILTLKDVTFNEALGTYVTAPQPYKSPQTISILCPLQDTTVNGVIANLSFDIATTAKDGNNSPIEITFDEDDVFNGKMENVPLEVNNGNVQIYEGIPGDIDGDKKVNNKDAILLFRYVAGSEVTVDKGALDVNADGKVNNRDAILLFRYVAGWPGIVLYRGQVCIHDLIHTEYQAASCTEKGNIEYWTCDLCGRCFSDENATKSINITDTVIEAKGHTVVIDKGKPATNEEDGLTDGSHCSECGDVLVEQKVIPKINKESYAISYHIATNDEYLAQLNIDNPNPNYYYSEDGLRLKNISAEGYVFDGWYDGEGKNGELIKEIPKGITGEIDLYAHWSLKEYIITFDSPLVSVESKKYTVNMGATLNSISLSGYNFMGWSNKNCELVTSIPVGTTGNITLCANWTSKRNQTRPVSRLGEPIVFEDTKGGNILFAYEIGTIENVPLSQISEMYQSSSGMKQTFTTSTSTSTSSEKAKEIANTVSNSTTNSSAWSLSENWNDVTSVSQTYAEEKGWSTSEAETHSKTSTDTYSLNSSSGGSNTTMSAAGLSGTLSNSSSNTIGGSYSRTKESGSEYTVSDKGSISSELGASMEVPKVGGINAKMSASVEVEETEKNYEKDSSTVSMNASRTGTSGSSVTGNNSSSTTGVSSWNTTSGYSSSNSVSDSTTISKVLSGVISETKGYGQSYSKGGSNNESQSFANSEAETNQYSSSVTYSSATTNTNSTTIELGGANEGYYRFVLAGTAHVFAMVGYNIANRAYYTYTYTIMDDNTYTFIDYSKTTPNFNDCENGVLPFEVPYYVKDYVDARILKTGGLEINTSTGVIENYTGTDTLVFVPAYMAVDNIDGNGNTGFVKVTGISSDAFKGRDDIVAVTLSNFITQIPDNAFNGCSSLTEILAPGITEIGENAFSGCSSLRKFEIPNVITSLGKNSFNGVPEIAVSASTLDVIDGGVSSGAKKITLNISNVKDDVSKLNIDVPTEVDYFELQGGNKEYSDLKITSKAKTTYLNGLSISDCKRIPFDIYSENLVLNGMSVTCPGYALLLHNENTNISLYQVNNIISESGNAIVARDISISQLSSGVTSALNVSGNIYVCGKVTGENNLKVTNGNIVYISEDEYAKYIKGSFIISFDPNDGQVSTESKTCYCASPVGELPIPIKDYNNFDGWWTSKEGGTEIKSDSIITVPMDITLFAHWKIKDTSDWVLEENMPDGSKLVQEKWTYDLTTKTTSSQNTLEGYELYDTTWQWGNYGSWSGWQNSYVGSSDSRNVETRWISPTYKTVWRYSRYISYSQHLVSLWQLDSSYVYESCEVDSPKPRFSTGDINGNPCYGSYPFTSMWYSESTASVQTAAGYTQYRYQDRSKVYTYHFTKTEPHESYIVVTPSDSVSNVKRWVKYIAK